MAEKLGMTRQQLLTSMTSAELSAWQQLWMVRAEERAYAELKRKSGMGSS